MSKDKTVQAYLDTVAAQIRWKRARAMVTWELARHLEDQRSAFAAAGYANAEQLAVEEMGDPVSVGAGLHPPPQAPVGSARPHHSAGADRRAAPDRADRILGAV